MGNILVDSNGNALLSGGNALEVTSAIDSNIQAGNIKKDVTILGVTGTYEGSGGGGGGFRCTNKRFMTGESVFLTWCNNYQYTFNGQLDSAALGFMINGGSEHSIIGTNMLNNYFSPFTVTYSTLMFQDYFCEPRYGTAVTGAKVITNQFRIVEGNYVDTIISINNQGVLSRTDKTSYSDDIMQAPLIVIFKGTDGTYDFDIMNFSVGDD